MSLVEAVRAVLGKYADFSGRARRSEYWYWTLAVVLAYVAVTVINAVIRPLGVLLLVVVALGAFLPGLAVGVRRLHDTNRSGAFLLLGLIPLVGGIVLLVFTCSDGTPGTNRYGPSPKAADGFPPGYAYGS